MYHLPAEEWPHRPLQKSHTSLGSRSKWAPAVEGCVGSGPKGKYFVIFFFVTVCVHTNLLGEVETEVYCDGLTARRQTGAKGGDGCVLEDMLQCLLRFFNLTAHVAPGLSCLCQMVLGLFDQLIHTKR